MSIRKTINDYVGKMPYVGRALTCPVGEINDKIVEKMFYPLKMPSAEDQSKEALETRLKFTKASRNTFVYLSISGLLLGVKIGTENLPLEFALPLQIASALYSAAALEGAYMFQKYGVKKIKKSLEEYSEPLSKL